MKKVKLWDPSTSNPQQHSKRGQGLVKVNQVDSLAQSPHRCGSGYNGGQQGLLPQAEADDTHSIHSLIFAGRVPLAHQKERGGPSLPNRGRFPTGHVHLRQVNHGKTRQPRRECSYLNWMFWVANARNRRRGTGGRQEWGQVKSTNRDEFPTPSRSLLSRRICDARTT